MPTNFRTTMQTIGRNLGVMMTAQFGAELDSYHFTKSDVTIENVPCNPSGINTNNRISGASIQDVRVQFVIPISDAWPGENTPSNYDKIVYEGVNYWVTDCNTDNLNTRWYLKALRRESI